MYLHLGQDIVVKMDEIVGIFDLDTSTISKTTREFLSKAQMAGQVKNITDQLPKSFVVCKKKDGGQTVYISQISSTTLLKRSV
ncbi:MAG TPA: DUF370 domain-containing protein [Clostridiales bacterium]|nr:DUF370 domain-containing protein [Clostridiales bacterium]